MCLLHLAPSYALRPHRHAPLPVALLTAEQQGGAAGRLARTRVRQLLQARASADACGAWRPLSRWLLALQAFVSQVRYTWLCMRVPLVCFSVFCISGTLNNLSLLVCFTGTCNCFQRPLQIQSRDWVRNGDDVAKVGESLTHLQVQM